MQASAALHLIETQHLLCVVVGVSAAVDLGELSVVVASSDFLQETMRSNM